MKTIIKKDTITLDDSCPICTSNEFKVYECECEYCTDVNPDIYLDCAKCGFNLPDCRNDLKKILENKK
jgi:hypothetical protein